MPADCEAARISHSSARAEESRERGFKKEMAGRLAVGAGKQSGGPDIGRELHATGFLNDPDRNCAADYRDDADCGDSVQFYHRRRAADNSFTRRRCDCGGRGCSPGDDEVRAGKVASAMSGEMIKANSTKTNSAERRLCLKE